MLALFCLLPVERVPAQTGQARADYRNPKLSVERRVGDLLARMTLEEKVGQMLCMWNARRQITDAQGRFDPAKAPKWFKVGIGRIERPSEGRGARAEAEFTNAIQRWVKENTRLAIPVIFHEEALHGLEGPEATSFPQAIGLASTWNPDLVERVFAATAREVRSRGAQQVLAFLYPFEVGVQEGHARSVMPSYNEIDGIPSHANRWMLEGVLRKEWRFDGTIVSDWQGISQLAKRHRVAANSAEAARFNFLIVPGTMGSGESRIIFLYLTI